MAEGTIFNIQRFCVNDGPGIRTTVFLKGCPLNCLWCHNPESKSPNPELFFNPEKCVGCRRCEAACPESCHSFGEGGHIFDRGACTVCGRCAAVCPEGALEIVGRRVSTKEVMAEVLRDRVFYSGSGGGLTLSGGEPLYQYDFSLELLKMAKENGLHTCVETSGFVTQEKIIKIAAYTDIFLYDCKETDPVRHKEFTGVSNTQIIDNLFCVDKMGAGIILRCPIIPGYNDRQEHLENIGRLAEKLENIRQIEVEPYHPLGKSKAFLLAKEYAPGDLESPDEKTVTEWIRAISAHTKVPVKRA